MNRSLLLFATAATFGLVAACGDDSPSGTGGSGGSGDGGASSASSGETSSTDASSVSESSSNAGGNGGGTCEVTNESTSVGAGPSDLTCFAELTCGSVGLGISCNGNADGSSTCTCSKEGADVQTCEQETGPDCTLESGCCGAVF